MKANGGVSSKEEADFLEVMSLFVAQNPETLSSQYPAAEALTRDLNDPLYTLLVQQAFPGGAIPSLGPSRSDKKPHVEGEENKDESSHRQEAGDEDGSFSSSKHEDSKAAIESEKERGHDFERAQEPDHRASASNLGNEHQDALLAYIERQRHKPSKSQRRRHGPRAKAEKD